MKKFLATAIAAVFMLTSCSKDPDTVAQTNTVDTSVLLKKSITTKNDETLIANYTYSGNKLQYIEYSNGSREIYKYNGEKLEKIEEYRNDDLYRTQKFLYNSSSKLIEYQTILSNGYTESENFIHQSGKIKVVKSSVSGTMGSFGELYLNGDNVSSYVTIAENTEAYTFSYTYDVKNNPLRNMYANDVLAIANRKGGVNNVLKCSKSGPANHEGYIANYTYNEKGFPLIATQTQDNGEETVTEYFYE